MDGSGDGPLTKVRPRHILHEQMRLRIGPGEGANSLVLEGELDLATAEQLRSSVDLCSQPEGEFVLDCRGLTFIDAAGARVLVGITERVGEGCRLVLEGPSGIVLRVLSILRLDADPRIEIRP